VRASSRAHRHADFSHFWYETDAFAASRSNSPAVRSFEAFASSSIPGSSAILRISLARLRQCSALSWTLGDRRAGQLVARMAAVSSTHCHDHKERPMYQRIAWRSSRRGQYLTCSFQAPLKRAIPDRPQNPRSGSQKVRRPPADLFSFARQLLADSDPRPARCSCTAPCDKQAVQ
jgi:hypothetical protein